MAATEKKQTEGGKGLFSAVFLSLTVFSTHPSCLTSSLPLLPLIPFLHLLLSTPVFPTDPKICTLTPNGHLDLSPLPPGLFPGEKLTFALGSRKNSVISLGRANLEQRAVVSGKDCKEMLKLKKST